MSINVNEDVIGGGGMGGLGWGSGNGGIILIAILLIFVVMGGGLLGGRAHAGEHGGHWGRHGCEDSCADKMTWSRFANFEDPAIAKVQTEIACTTGQIKTQNAVDTGAIIHNLDMQTCEIKLGDAAIIQNQMQIAREQEVMALTSQINALRDDKLELRSKLLQQETVNSINAGNCQLNHRLDRMECEMAKRPPFYTAGGFPHTQPFNFQNQGFDGRRNDCCCGVV